MSDVELPDHQELAEQASKAFPKRVALTTAVFAVLLAVSSLGGNNATKEMMLSQQQASDQWAFYQSKAMREHLYKTNGARLEIDILERGSGMKPAARSKYEEMLKNMRAEEARYREEKKTIEQEARRLEAERDRNQTKDPYFDYAEVMLQISIVLASISILAGSRPVYYFSIGCALLGGILMLNGYLLFIRLPFLH